VQAVVGAADRIYVGIGDATSVNRFAVFTLWDGALAPLGVPQNNPFCSCGYGGVATSIGETVYVFGNYGHAFDGDEWTELAYDRARKRGEAAITAYRGEIVLIGGRHFVGDDSNAISDTMEAYDPRMDQWRDVPGGESPFGPIRNASATVSRDELFLVAPGEPIRVASWDATRWHIETAAPLSSAGPRVAAFGSNLFVLDGRHTLARFDTVRRRWLDPIEIPEGTDMGLVVADCTLWLVGRDGTELVFYRMGFQDS
jgi:hypothetical protein